jgi:hypothetical protein
MGAPLTSLLCLTALLVAGPAQEPRSAPQQISFNRYLDQLDHIRALVEALDERRPAGAGDILVQVPPAWRVTIEDRQFETSAEWIRRGLIEWRTSPTRAERELLATRLGAVRAEAARYLDRPADVSADRERLQAILSAREFQGLEGPSWLDRLRQRAVAWLVGILTRLLGSSSIPTITNLLVYLAIATVVVLISAFAYRALRRSAEIDSIRPDRIPPVARPWTIWLDEARAAAARNDWPEAVHLAYWCGIAFLEANGAWRPDRSRTPREYLRVLGTSHEHRPALQALTGEFERVWYAAAGADASHFDAMLGELEKLGCRSR